ncbi:unnamed protein product [Rotaria sp. Silwood1]|nr:unnamed protein product [Rotaria sp. Silwood1]CAF1522726.1 unnamed protein product [Rotaria sp. Silwood1]
MLRKSKGPIIQVDRLVFDTRNKTKQYSIISDVSHSSAMLSLPSNLSNKKTQEEISTESYVSFPSNKLKVIRLTLDDINHEKKIYSNNQQSSLILEEKMKKKDETIFSPVYESIDEKRDTINRNEKNKYINNDQFEIL